MKKWLTLYFGFNRREFNGLVILMVLILLLMLLPYGYRVLKPDQPITDAEQQAIWKLALEEQQKLAQGSQYKTTERGVVSRKGPLFKFDPNTIEQAGWEKLGLSARQAQSILKYRKRGGQFRTVTDLRKMYTITEHMYLRLAPYVSIVATQQENQALKFKPYLQQNPSKILPLVVEINGADTIELDKIKGIGPVFAKRIVAYRDRIGGFYKKEQLMEVFGLDSIKFTEIKAQLSIDLGRLKKININTVQFEDLRNHPYLRYKQINALIQYRKQHGNYSNIADLNKIVILNQESISRLAPYLEF